MHMHYCRSKIGKGRGKWIMRAPPPPFFFAHIIIATKIPVLCSKFGFATITKNTLPPLSMLTSVRERPGPHHHVSIYKGSYQVGRPILSRIFGLINADIPPQIDISSYWVYDQKVDISIAGGGGEG